jgi:hypothetical protein
MTTTPDIEAAIAALRISESPNISAVAREFKIDRSRLSRLYRGIIRTREQFASERGFLSQEQDKKLVSFVKRLTDDGIPPTPKQVRQFAKELAGELPGKNWAADWLKRHANEIGSGYLKGFDLSRKKADNHWQYEAYFSLVIDPGNRRFCADFGS